MTTILVINNYGQFAHLILRTLRDLEVNSELVKNTLTVSELLEKNPDGLVLSGGPTLSRIGNCKQYVLEVDLPILGICLGHQLIAEAYGGVVSKGTHGGYADVYIDVLEEDEILEGLGPTIKTWASHADEVTLVPVGFKTLARSDICDVEAMKHSSKPIYGVQWHPEVAHSEKGNELFLNFIDKCDRQ
ncbi:MAG TPA: GMP synthase subunit A [Candidatus Acidoferrum sp.]|nr:GMP synthase subunit A [Candidatus Acidoferrum sp.]